MQVQQRLERLAVEELEQVRDHVIFLDGGCYHVFGQYEIRVSNHGCTLESARHDRKEFGSIRAALAWCIADKYQRHDISQDIRNLDQQQQWSLADIAARLHLARQIRDPGRRETAMLKVDQRRRRLSFTQDRLNKCINLTKYWQIRGFNNETARSGRTPFNTKNR